MNKKEIIDELQKAMKFLELKGYNVCFISVYGSQNYGLDVYTDEYKSDIDFKAVIIPSLKDLVNNSKPLSTTIQYLDGQIDIKDIRVFVPTLCKCNPAYIETLYSEYSIASPDFQLIVDERENLVSEMGALLLRAAFGMIKEKEHAFSHPYPSIIDKIEKHGYDPKQLHHIERLKNLISEYIYGGKYVMTQYDNETTNWLLDIKKGKLPLERAKAVRDCGVKVAKGLVDNYDKEPVFDAKNRVVQLSKDLVYNHIKKKCQQELGK